MNNDTIAAISTPLGKGGIGIIKISGNKAKHIASSIFRKTQKNDKNNYLNESHKLYHGHIIDPESQKAIDEVLLSVMYAPHSYTGEDVVEINVHSGTYLLNKILSIIIDKGARIAEPGEFTKRAFINGRIDLTQAEAVIDIINAKNKKALEIANAQVDGVLKKDIEKIIDVLEKIIIKIEAAIDFPEETEQIILEYDINNIENNVIKKLKNLINGYEDGKILREGIKLVIAGRPNVGKSSIMNKLLKKERAIVTSIPGTTRDIIEETINISGINAIISDTAGLHETKDPIESIGIEKAKKEIECSDIILFVIDANNPFTKEDKILFEKIYEKSLIVVINKIDLLKSNELIVIDEDIKKIPHVKISCLYNKGIDILKETIKEIATKNIDYNSIVVIPNIRQKTYLEKCLNNAISVLEGMKKEEAYEILSIDLAEAIDSLNQIIGNNIKPDILEKIFSRFCIGK